MGDKLRSQSAGFWLVYRVENSKHWKVLNEYFQDSFSSAQNIFIINLDAILTLSYRPVAIAIL